MPRRATTGGRRAALCRPLDDEVGWVESPLYPEVCSQKDPLSATEQCDYSIRVIDFRDRLAQRAAMRELGVDDDVRE
jgi:hypothetical protein